MLTVVLETVEVLVSFATDLTPIWLLFLHADGSGVWNGCGWVDDGKGAVGILLELLILVAML